MRRLWERMKFRQKLLASYLLVFIMAMAVLSGYMVETSRRYMYENNRRTLNGMVEKAGANWAMKLEQYDQSITMCAYQSELQTLYSNRYLSYYDLYIKLANLLDPFYTGVRGSHADEVSNIYLYSTMGLSKYGPYLRSASEVENGNMYKEGMLFSGIRWHFTDGAMYATCRADPVTMLLGRAPLGLLYFEINTNVFMQRYAHIDWPEYSVTVSDAGGGELARYGGESAQNALTLSARVNRAGWTLEYHIPVNTLYGDGLQLAAGGAMVLIISAFAMLLIIFAFSRALLSGVGELRRGMARVREGDLNVYLRSNSQDEIGELTNMFSDMVVRIRLLIDKAKRDERRMSDLEYRSLRTQIDPHFLYNTLSFIRWKCLKAGQTEVSHVVEQLSIFYRTCLNKGGDLTDVEGELSNIRAYLEIQTRLHDDSFDVTYDIPPELISRKMPCFVLQPLLENAIIHGVDPLRDRRGSIVISLREESGALVFRVTDNGNGVDMARAGEINAPGLMSGVSNVHERIVLLAGEQYGFSIRNLPGGGCEAKLTLPISYEQTP